MNDPLSILGNSLAAEFRQNISQWLPAVTLFSVDDVFGSLKSSDQLIQISGKWNDLALLDPTLETDFIPKDLVDGFFEKPIPEQVSEDSIIDGKSAARRTRSSLKKDSFNENIFGNTGIQKQASSFLNEDEWNKAPENPGSFSENEIRSEIEQNRDDVGESLNDSGSISKAVNSIFSDEKSISKNEKTISSKDEMDFLKENEINENQKHSDDSKKILQKQLDAQNTNFKSDNPNSIWTAPLRGLSDFAGVVSKDASDKKDHSVTAGNDLKTSSENVAETKQAFKEPATPNGRNFQDGWVTIPDPVPERSDLNLSPLPLQPASSFAPPANGTATENLPFPNAPQPTPAPDTDELLEALTDRILRDFRRYYP